MRDLLSIILALLALLANSGSAAAEDARARRPLDLQTVAIPSSINGAEITSAALSSGGLLALGTAAGHLSIVDRNLQAWRGGWERSAGSSAILRIAFSQDEAAIAGLTSDAVVVWRLDDPTVVKIPFKGSPSAMALGPGGRLIAVGNFDISVFDISSQRVVRQFKQDIDGGASVYERIAFTPDGAVVAAASPDNIDAWNIESGKRVQHWSCKCQADGAGLSGDAALAVVGTTYAHALLWELASGKVVKDKLMSTLYGDHVYGVAVNLKGTLVAAGTASGSVVVWDTGSGVIVARAHPSDRPVTGITSSHDGQVLLVEGPKAVYVRDSYDRWLMTLTRR